MAWIQHRNALGREWVHKRRILENFLSTPNVEKCWACFHINKWTNLSIENAELYVMQCLGGTDLVGIFKWNEMLMVILQIQSSKFIYLFRFCAKSKGKRKNLILTAIPFQFRFIRFNSVWFYCNWMMTDEWTMTLRRTFCLLKWVQHSVGWVYNLYKWFLHWKWLGVAFCAMENVFNNDTIKKSW